MLKWKKKGLIFNPTEVTDRAWLKEFAQGPSVIVLENRVRVYFSCRPPIDAQGKYVSYSSYLELDRCDLTRILEVAKSPVLKLGKRGTFDEFGTYPISVIAEKEKYVAFYAGWTRCESVPFNVAIGKAVSTDGGETFIKQGDGPIIPYTIDEPFVMSGPKIRRFNNQWYLFYIAGKKWIPNRGKPEPVYRVRMATSVDGLNWQKLGRDLIPCKLEEDECQASPDVLFYNNKYHLFYCYRYSLDYRSGAKGYRIGYASSADLLKWTRDDDFVGIDVSEEGWDSEMIAYPHVFELDGKVYMFYLGNQVGRYGFGLAELQNPEIL